MINLIGAAINDIMQNSRKPLPRFCTLPGFKTTSCLTIVLLVCLETVLLSTVSTCAKTFYIHWNTTNSIFRIDNTDHIIDVNKGNSLFEYDQVHIICPVYDKGTFDNETERYIIYNVSKAEYETCRITNANPRIIAICDKPQRLMFFTITFRPFTPQPGGLEFLPGHDYYFISTSSKDDIHRRIGGRCSTNNMKIVFKVCCGKDDDQLQQNKQQNGSSWNKNGTRIIGNDKNNNNQQQLSSSSANNNNNNNNNNNSYNNNGGVSINTNIDITSRVPPLTNINNGMIDSGYGIPQLPNINTNNSNVVQSTIGWPRYSHHPQSTPVTSTKFGQQFNVNPHVTSPRPTINNPINSNIYNNNNQSPSHKPTKKTHEYDKHPNEVVKNEELTYSNKGNSRYKSLIFSSSSSSSFYYYLVTISAILLTINSLSQLNSWCQR